MHELHVEGEIRSLGWREGASGKLTGAIEGLFEGYRASRTASSQQDYLLETEHGSLALSLAQEVRVRHPLPSRPAEHPFRDGRDPFAGLQLTESRLPDLPPEAAQSGPRRNLTTVVRVLVDPQKSTGSFSGAQGEMTLTLPDPNIHGHMVIETADGTIRLSFREKMEQAQLSSELWIEGGESTGIYHNARGALTFRVSVFPPNFARGTYSGTLWLEQLPAGS